MSQDFSNKLYQYTALPARHNWEEIAAAIGDQMSPASRVLALYEETPPAAVWDKIAEGFERQETAPVSPARIPARSRFGRPFRMVAAAAVLLLVAALITLYVNNGGAAPEMARQPGSRAQDISSPAADSPKNSSDAAAATPPSQDRPEPKPPEPIAMTKGTRYVVMANEDGNKVRLSKKAFTVFECAENSAPENKERCKENIQLMQQKMAASMLSPSGDFGGLIDMIKSLEEND